MRLRSGAHKHYPERASIIVIRPVEHDALCTRAAAGDERTIYTYIHIQFVHIVLIYVGLALACPN